MGLRYGKGNSMKKLCIDELINGINRTLDDGGSSIISVGTVRAYGGCDWIAIRKFLVNLEAKGVLRIIQDPEGALPNVPCLEMYSYIDRKSVIPGFLNWQ